REIAFFQSLRICKVERCVRGDTGQKTRGAPSRSQLGGAAGMRLRTRRGAPIAPTCQVSKLRRGRAEGARRRARRGTPGGRIVIRARHVAAGLVALVLALVPWLARAQDLGTIKVGVLEYGTVNWELDVIRHHGLDKQHGF